MFFFCSRANIKLMKHYAKTYFLFFSFVKDGSYPEASLVIIKLIINLAFVICHGVQETSHFVVFDTWNHFFD